MSYKPNYTKSDIGMESTTANVSGCSPQANLLVEENAQRVVAENQTWLIAKKENHLSRSTNPIKEKLEQMGFVVLREHDDLFYAVQPPEGWNKETEGYWTIIKDQEGNKRIQQFYKGAFYDRDAFVNFL